MPSPPDDTTVLAQAVYALGDATSRADVDAVQAAFGAVGTPDQVAIVAEVARIALGRLRAVEDARLDALTGVLNRRGFYAACRDRLAAAPGPMLAGLFDLDGLKAINDHHGHDAGSRSLRAAAEALQATFPEAVIGRIGGDEFAALMPADVDPDTLHARLQATVRARAALPDVVALALSAGFAGGDVVATSDVDALLRCADADLYVRRGRRRAPHLRLRTVGRRHAAASEPARLAS